MTSNTRVQLHNIRVDAQRLADRLGSIAMLTAPHDAEAQAAAMQAASLAANVTAILAKLDGQKPFIGRWNAND